MSDPDILKWLHRWQDLINSRDIDTARPMFSDDVYAFGSLANAMEGRTELIARQWSQMWPRIRDFAFHYDEMHVIGEGSPFVVVAAPWHSLGKKGDGWYDRRGRATLVLMRTPEKGYICVHSHFSMEPGIPPRAD